MPLQSGLGNPSNMHVRGRKSAYIPIEQDESDNHLVQIHNTAKWNAEEESMRIVSEVMHYRLKELVNNEKSNILQAPQMPATYSRQYPAHVQHATQAANYAFLSTTYSQDKYCAKRALLKKYYGELRQWSCA